MVYRDDPPQSYSFEAIEVEMELGNGPIPGRAGGADERMNAVARAATAVNLQHRPLTKLGSTVASFTVVLLLGTVLAAYLSLCVLGPASRKMHAAEEERRQIRQRQVQSLLLHGPADSEDGGL